MDKSHMHVHETITNMAIMVFLKEKIEESEINISVQNLYLSQWALVAAIQFGLMYCMAVVLVADDAYKIYVT